MQSAVFPIVFANIIPLYVSIGLGYVAGKYLKVENSSIASLLFYIISPLVMFSGPAGMVLQWKLLALPLIVFLIGSLIALATYYLSKGRFDEELRSILAFSSGTNNSGYVGLPIMMALFDHKAVSLYIVMVMGVSLYENTFGYFLAARGQYSTGESLRRLLKIPALYAFIFGCLMSFAGVQLPTVVSQYVQNIRGCYTILGIMQIGIGLSQLSTISLNLKFTGYTFFAKFVVWPLCMGALVVIDCLFTKIYGHDAHNGLLMLGYVPLAANTVAIATLLKLHPENMAAAVGLSFLVVLVVMPLMVTLTFFM
jgi:predicted permease